jgi:Histidine kinase
VSYSHLLKHRVFFSTNAGLYSLSGDVAENILFYKDHDKDFYDYPIEPVFFIDRNNRFYCCYSQTCITIDGITAGKKSIHMFKSRQKPYIAYYKSIAFAGSRLYLQSRISISVLDVLQMGAGCEFLLTELDTRNGSDRIFTMAIAPDSSIWYSTVKEVYKIQNDQGVQQPQFKDFSFKFFNFYGRHLIGYTNDNQLLICSDVDGNISIDSVSSQNCIWDKLYKVNDSTILISTNNYYRLLTIPATGSLRKYRLSILEDPFLPLECEYVCFDSSACYFFKNGSITSIGLNCLSGKPELPDLFFTILKTSKATYRISDIIELPYGESRNINVAFMILSHGNKNISYQFSVSKTGQDVWTDVKGEVINLVNPGYGQYVIKVKAKTLSNEFSVPIVFTLHVLRPYWATWWFVALCICAAGAFIGGIIRYRFLYVVRKNKKAHETEVKFIRSEFKSMNALMNPHFIFNTLNNVQGLFNGNDKLAANEYLRVFADLIRQNMHNVSKELIPLQKEIALVMNYLMLEKLRFDEKLKYNINIDDAIDLSDIMVPPLLIQPLVENSIKHGILPLKGKQGIVEINIFERSGVLSIEVRDNGPGMMAKSAKVADAHESFGMASIKKRIAQLSIIQNKKILFHAGEIRDESGYHLWTTVIIRIPVS